jgi:hypothetical protein
MTAAQRPEQDSCFQDTKVVGRGPPGVGFVGVRGNISPIIATDSRAKNIFTVLIMCTDDPPSFLRTLLWPVRVRFKINASSLWCVSPVWPNYLGIVPKAYSLLM